MTFTHRFYALCFLLFGLFSAALSAQTLAGVWQGTLPVNHDARVVVRLDVSGEGALRGTFQWVDRDVAGVPFSTVALHEGEVEAESDVLHVTFRGNLSADGQSLAGTWTQEQKGYPLTLIRTAPEQAWRHGGATIAAMDARADPAFEVASIRPSAPGAKGRRYDLRTRDFGAHNASVMDLVKFAYQLRDRQISGAPSWMNDEKFDISGKPDTPGQPTVDQYRMMVNKLLAERFQLHSHTVQQSFAVYALTLTTPRSLLTPSNPNLNAYGISLKPDEANDTTQVRFMSESMAEFADILMNFIEDRQVVDETGLSGRFDFTMVLPTAALQSADSGEKATAFLRAVQPLGLKLVPKSAEVPVLVVEHVQHPSAN